MIAMPHAGGEAAHRMEHRFGFDEYDNAPKISEDSWI